MPGAGTVTTKPSLGVSKATPEASVGMDMHPGLLKEVFLLLQLHLLNIFHVA